MSFIAVGLVYCLVTLYLIRSKTKYRVITGLLLAPLAPCIAIALFQQDMLVAIIAIPFSYSLATSSLPAYFILRYFNALQFPWIVLVSAGLGPLSYFIFSGPTTVNNIMLLSGLSTVTGIVFWLIAFQNWRSNK